METRRFVGFVFAFLEFWTRTEQALKDHNTGLSQTLEHMRSSSLAASTSTIFGLGTMNTITLVPMKPLGLRTVSFCCLDKRLHSPSLRIRTGWDLRDTDSICHQTARGERQGQVTMAETAHNSITILKGKQSTEGQEVLGWELGYCWRYRIGAPLEARTPTASTCC